MRRPFAPRPGAALQRLWRDQRGAAAVYVAVAAAVLMGIVGLVLDGSRTMITHSEAQAAADAAALAAASQLDASATALTRATQAAQGSLVNNSQRFANGGVSTVSISSIRFLSGLPASDSTNPIPASFDTTDPTNARFVQVTTQQLTQNATLIGALSNETTVQLRGVAVAGFRQIYCKIPPVMICNPDETTPGAPFSASARPGVEVQAKIQGPGASWGPGAYGLLEPPICVGGGGGASCVRDELASIAPNSCFQNKVDVEPGTAAGPSRDGTNVRFGIYGGPVRMSANTAPDSNITQDFTNQNGSGRCYQDPAIRGVPFPDDTVLSESRVGNGLWDCLTYWTANHTQPAPAGCTHSSGAPMTRYAVYKLETSGTPSRFGAPLCSVPGVADRRVMYLTVVNCRENAVSGNSTNLPVLALVKTFLLKPVSSGPDAEMDLEIIEVVSPGVNNEVLKDDVQLYR